MDNSRKPLVVVQARTGSTRLPNKMLMPFYDGKPVLEILLTRLRAMLGDDAGRLVVATTECAGDNGIEQLCRKMEINLFRGSENDVLDRFIGAAGLYGGDRLIRVCADNVFLDAVSFRYLYERMMTSDADYESFCTADGTPSIRTHYGFWAEGVTVEALKRVASMTDEPLYHEHVTNYVYGHPDEFNVNLTPMEAVRPGVERHHDMRLTLDTADDFRVQQEIFAAVCNDPSPQCIIAFLERHPQLSVIMRKNIEANSK